MQYSDTEDGQTPYYLYQDENNRVPQVKIAVKHSPAIKGDWPFSKVNLAAGWRAECQGARAEAGPDRSLSWWSMQEVARAWAQMVALGMERGNWIPKM